MMSLQTTMTLTDLRCYLRQRLVDAMSQHDPARISDLQQTLVLLQEAAWEVQDERRAALIQDMIDAARDALVGVQWKANLPSVEAIRAAETG